MILIEKIEIYYFRSIYTLVLSNLKDLCVLSGKNDCGKSNILKALNLFFNNETDWQAKLDFSKDFSFKRLEEVRKETIKGRQFIRVKIHFRRGKMSTQSLPDRFFVSKTWYRDSSTPEIKSSIEQKFRDGKIKTSSFATAQAGLQRFLNRMRFEYIPAIKDRNFSIYMLGLLQDTILQMRTGKSKIVESITGLNTAVENGAAELNKEFESVCGIKTDIRLPQALAELFRAFSVYTGNKEGELPITMRGDGIQTRYIPSLLHYVAQNSRLIYLWGFEEPENCLEHSLATELSYNLRDTYSKKSQIIITSHSPAFLGLESENLTSFRIFSDNTGTEAICIFPSKNGTAGKESLREELGLLDFEKKHQEEFIRRKEEIKREQDQVEKLKQVFTKAQSPILLTEGKTDVLILEEAWQRLYPTVSKKFRILSCGTTEDGDTAGVGILKKALESCRHDEPLTIGLFDRDEEGINTFKNLDKTFKFLNDSSHIKIHDNKRVAAFLIPHIDEKNAYIAAKNLQIEFLFSEPNVERKFQDKGLLFEYKKKTIRVENITLEETVTSEPHFRKIKKESKKYFAERVVPTFDDDAFDNFAIIFDEFEKIKKNCSALPRGRVS